MSCPVCFNAAASDDTVRQSLNIGIFVLLACTAIVLAGFLRFIVSIVQKSSAHEDGGVLDRVTLNADHYVAES